MKKLTKNILFAASICLSTPLQAQDFTYEKIKDTPEGMDYLRGSISIWDMNLSGYNLSLWNFNPKLEVYIDRKLKIEGEYSYALADRIYPEGPVEDFTTYSKPAVTSIYKTNAASNYSILGTWYFMNKVEEEDITIHVKSNEGGNINYVSSIPSKVVHSVGLRLGYTNGSSLYYLNGAEINGMENNQKTSFNLGINASATVSYSMIKLGLGFNKVFNLDIDTDLYDERTSQGAEGWYVDAFIPLSFTYDDVYYNNGYGYTNSQGVSQVLLHKVNINQHNPKLPIGAAIGMYENNIKGSGFGFGAEAGIMPGMTSTYLQVPYARLTFFYDFAVSF